MFRRLAVISAFATVLFTVGSTPFGADAADRADVCIDPGHNLVSPGAVVTVSDGKGRRATTHELREVDINLDVARDVAAQLGTAGYSVVMTWGGSDDGLDDTRSWIRQDGPVEDLAGLISRGAWCSEHADAMVSIHTNGAALPFNGTMTLYRNDEVGSLEFAQTVHGLIYDALRFDHRGKRVGGFRNFGLQQDVWAVSRGIIPTVLLEPVVMTNTAEAERLLSSIDRDDLTQNRREQIADAETAAVLGYLPPPQQ